MRIIMNMEFPNACHCADNFVILILPKIKYKNNEVLNA